MTILTDTATLECGGQEVAYVYRGPISGTGDHLYTRPTTPDFAPKFWGVLFQQFQTASGSNGIAQHNSKDPGETSGTSLRGWNIFFDDSSSPTMRLTVADGTNTNRSVSYNYGTGIRVDGMWHAWSASADGSNIFCVADGDVANTATAACVGYTPALNADNLFINGGVYVNRNLAIAGWVFGSQSLTLAQMAQWQQDCRDFNSVVPLPVGTTYMYSPLYNAEGSGGPGFFVNIPWEGKYGNAPTLTSIVSGSTTYPIYDVDSSPTWAF